MIGGPWKMEFDGQDAVFVTDLSADKVLEFALDDGTFRQTWGRVGRGPGEYGQPGGLDVEGEWLYVGDIQNRRIVAFNFHDESSGILNVEDGRAFQKFKVYKEAIYGIAFRSSSEQASILNEDPEENLIRVYDKNGSLINSFGDFLNMEEAMPVSLSDLYIEIEEDIIHVAFLRFPIYRAYNLDGEMLADINLSETFFDVYDDERNLDATNYNPDAQGLVRLSVAFRAMDVYKNRIFLCREQRGGITIDEYRYNNGDLTHHATYTYDNNLVDSYATQDFFYHSESNSFYVSGYNDVPKVSVYRLPEGE